MSSLPNIETVGFDQSAISDEANVAQSEDTVQKNEIFEEEKTRDEVVHKELADQVSKSDANELSKFDPTSRLNEYEQLFKNRYMEEDKEYVKSANILSVEPVIIYPWPPAGTQRTEYRNRSFGNDHNRYSRGGPYRNYRGRRGNNNNYNSRNTDYGRNRGGYDGNRERYDRNDRRNEENRDRFRED